MTRKVAAVVGIVDCGLARNAAGRLFGWILFGFLRGRREGGRCMYPPIEGRKQKASAERRGWSWRCIGGKRDDGGEEEKKKRWTNGVFQFQNNVRRCTLYWYQARGLCTTTMYLCNCTLLDIAWPLFPLITDG